MEGVRPQHRHHPNTHTTTATTTTTTPPGATHLAAQKDPISFSAGRQRTCTRPAPAPAPAPRYPDTRATPHAGVLGGPVLGTGHIKNPGGIPSMQACGCLCRGTRGCVAFDYEPAAGALAADQPNCWLKDNADVTAPRAQRISGVLCNGTAPAPALAAGNCSLPPMPPPSPTPPHPRPRPPSPHPPRPRPGPPTPTPPAPPPSTKHVAAAVSTAAAVHTTLDAYASVDLDWWHDCGACSGGYCTSWRARREPRASHHCPPTEPALQHPVSSPSAPRQQPVSSLPAAHHCLPLQLLVGATCRGVRA